MSSKPATELNFADIQREQVLVYSDGFIKTIIIAPTFNRFQCGACHKVLNRSTFGNHMVDRKDPKSESGFTPRCGSKVAWEAFLHSHNQVQLCLPVAKKPLFVAQLSPISVSAVYRVGCVMCGIPSYVRYTETYLVYRIRRGIPNDTRYTRRTFLHGTHFFFCHR